MPCSLMTAQMPDCSPWLLVQVCGCIFRMDSNADGPGVRFVHEHPEMLDILFQG